MNKAKSYTGENEGKSREAYILYEQLLVGCLDKIRKTVLCKSLAGNDVDMLIVTNFASVPEDIAMR